MKTVTLSDEDAAQVRAILLTHAEGQDQGAMANEELRGRLSTELQAGGDVEVEDALDDLEDVHTTLVKDSDNLKRLASAFE